ncbi:hypothetical protein P167DRAFT_531380 [Morchella conica CCBAS932]|uniref:Uncharacterized protein n=1 Tax=Morchella conica CCBAS932 TaxID=1392247 RepID=A0A3N4L6K4_9PEZI|nr:hypothetical protein P167DRAFT_531380 [Morchella conica CCBAS932]
MATLSNSMIDSYQYPVCQSASNPQPQASIYSFDSILFEHGISFLPWPSLEMSGWVWVGGFVSISVRLRRRTVRAAFQI